MVRRVRRWLAIWSEIVFLPPIFLSSGTNRLDITQFHPSPSSINPIPTSNFLYSPFMSPTPHYANITSLYIIILTSNLPKIDSIDLLTSRLAVLNHSTCIFLSSECSFEMQDVLFPGQTSPLMAIREVDLLL